MTRALTVTDLITQCESACGLDSYSPLLEHNYLLLNLDDGVPELPPEQIVKLAECLRLIACPVIAMGATVAPEWLRGVDVITANERDIATLIRNINEHPLAAMTLVQLLRHNEDVTPQQGLLAESLAYASLQGGVEFVQVIKNTPRPARAVEDSARTVLMERCGDELHITLNRPHVRNAYSAAMRDSLYEALQLLKMDSDLHRAVVRGGGSCFCIGGDLNEFGTVPDTSTAHAIRSSRSVGQLLLQLSMQLEFHLHSACIGAGIELPAFAARVVADKTAFMQLPEIKLGLLPGAGGTVSILRRIGRHRTAYLALSARRINATTALQWGLIDAIN